MHPKVAGEKGEQCPNCRMKLIPKTTSLRVVAFKATLHCLSGCAVGEILGMVIGNYLGLHNLATVGLSISLAFAFGYSFTLIPLVKSGIALGNALSLAFAADTVSISIMEIVDNLIMFFIPGAMDAHLTSLLFWGSLTFSLFVAFWAAYPVNMYLISRGKGHATVHKNH